MNAKKEFPRQTFAFCVDGLSSIIGSFMGTSPIAAFIESASGIREGGRCNPECPELSHQSSGQNLCICAFSSIMCICNLCSRRHHRPLMLKSYCTNRGRGC